MIDRAGGCTYTQSHEAEKKKRRKKKKEDGMEILTSGNPPLNPPCVVLTVG
jgi:hypothetical protein